MKKIITSLCIAFCFSTLVVKAQVPFQFNYQAIARNTAGQGIANATIKVKITILDGSASAAAVYSETRTVITNQLGLFNLAIGSTGAQSTTGIFTSVDWSTGKKFIKVEVDPLGGNNLVTLGTTELLSVPYALYAVNGKQGQQGQQGIQGVQGIPGNSGLIGLPGATGPQGIRGNTGSQGNTGPQGPQGLQGPQGALGLQGAQGALGSQGIVGKNALLKTSTEAAGVNCAEGGVKQEYGLDANSNGILENAEIDITKTTFICNGLSGGINNGWSKTGNANTNAASNFLGTTDNKPVVFKANNAEVFRATLDSFMVVGSRTAPAFFPKMEVNGSVLVKNNAIEVAKITPGLSNEVLRIVGNTILGYRFNLFAGNPSLPLSFNSQNNRVTIASNATQDATLDVARISGSLATAQFKGTTYNTVFNSNPGLQTFINAGTPNRTVFINDESTGSTVIGNAFGKINMKGNVISTKAIVSEEIVGTRKLNLIPLGTIEYGFTTTLSQFTSNILQNLTGNLGVASSYLLQEIGSDDFLRYTINFNPAITAGYDKIIAVGAPYFDSNGKDVYEARMTSFNDRVEIRYGADAFNNFRGYGVFMVYGIKNN